MSEVDDLMAQGLDREEADDLAHLGAVPPAPVAAPGVKVIKKGVYVYRCGHCGNKVRFDDRYEPVCTGPNPSLDEHPMKVMDLVEVSEPVVSVQAPAKLWVPGDPR